MEVFKMFSILFDHDKYIVGGNKTFAQSNES